MEEVVVAVLEEEEEEEKGWPKPQNNLRKACI